MSTVRILQRPWRRLIETADDKTFALDHFYCKLFKLPALLKTAGGRHLASNRARFLKEFVDQLALEFSLKEEEGALWLARTFHHAGKNNMRLFHPDYPFSEKREHVAENFIIDRCLLIRDRFPFVNRFLDQLKDELFI